MMKAADAEQTPGEHAAIAAATAAAILSRLTTLWTQPRRYQHWRRPLRPTSNVEDRRGDGAADEADTVYHTIVLVVRLRRRHGQRPFRRVWRRQGG